MSITFHPAGAARQHKASILVIPGGGFRSVGVELDGEISCKWLNDNGFDAWLLRKYSCAESSLVPLLRKPIDDAKKAVDTILCHREFRGELGIMGWSAGGWLAAFIATELDTNIKCVILVYPVITMEEGIAHSGSRDILLGEGADQEQVDAMSAEKWVTQHTPPTFLFHTELDEKVPLENSLRYAKAMIEKNRPFALQVQKEGRHGVKFDKWENREVLETWLRDIACKKPTVSGHPNVDDLKSEGGYIQNHKFE